MVVITFANIGTMLKTRLIAQEIREEVEKKIENGERVVLDFDKVTDVSAGFAEELIVKLAEKFGLEVFQQKIALQSVSAKVEKVFDSVIARIQSPPSK